MGISEVTATDIRKRVKYNPDSGEFHWRKGERHAGRRAGSNGVRYRFIGLGGQKYLEHRLAWLCFYGEWPSGQIDHINHDRADNRITNLRLVDHKENAKNARLYSTNNSGTCGVYWCKTYKKWKACIGVDGKSVHIGSFEDKEAAIAARKKAEVDYGFHENHGKVQ